MSVLPPSYIKGLESKEEILDQLVQEIKASFSKLFVTRAYISIIDAMGNFHHVETSIFDEYICFIHIPVAN